MQDWRTILGATVDMRREANRRIVAAMNDGIVVNQRAYDAAIKLHADAASIARNYRMR